MPLPAVKPAEPQVGTPTGHEVVLVVEDERAVRQLVRRALTEVGYRVMVAGDAVEALEILDQVDQVHVLVSDLVLPGMSGTELAARASQHHPDLAVVLMSGHAGAHRPVAGAELLTKPFAPSELVRRVREAIDGRDGQDGRGGQGG
jgi:DNA-binding NtrC family response regulator